MEDREEMTEELGRVLLHGKVPETGHLLVGRAWYRLAGGAPHLGGAAVVVLDVEDVDTDPLGVDLRGGLAEVELQHVVVEVAPEGRRPAGRVDLRHLFD